MRIRHEFVVVQTCRNVELKDGRLRRKGRCRDVGRHHVEAEQVGAQVLEYPSGKTVVIGMHLCSHVRLITPAVLIADVLDLE